LAASQGRISILFCAMLITWLTLKSLNRSLKSELTNIATFDPVRMDDQFPGGIKTRLGRLVLPELEIEFPIKFGQFAISLDKSRSHR
jgi:hypothetical protein